MMPSCSQQDMDVTQGNHPLAPEALTRCERTVTFWGLLLFAEPISRYFDGIVE
jgi:hypothetical protein